MGTGNSTPDDQAGRNTGQGTNSSQFRGVFHGFFSEYEDEELLDMHECTLFVTNSELVIGDQGEYEPLGGVLEALPPIVSKFAIKILADDEPSTIAYQTARNRNRSEQIALTDINRIEIEKGMPPVGKQTVEIERAYGGEISIFIGSAKSYGGKEQTQEFVSTLARAAQDAGGSPIVTDELDI